MASKRRAVIFDVDGTLADNTWRDPYDLTKVLDDKPIQPIIDLTKLFAQDFGITIIIVSAREEWSREDTAVWLDEHGVIYDHLFMRPDKDYRPDAEVKEELYSTFIGPQWDVLYVFDDRNSVVKRWRELGLTCLQVRDGDF